MTKRILRFNERIRRRGNRFRNVVGRLEKQLRPASGENEHFFVAVTLKVADAPKDYAEADSKMTHSHFKHVNLQPVFKNTLIPI